MLFDASIKADGKDARNKLETSSKRERCVSLFWYFGKIIVSHHVFILYIDQERNNAARNNVRVLSS